MNEGTNSPADTLTTEIESISRHLRKRWQHHRTACTSSAVQAVWASQPQGPNTFDWAADDEMEGTQSNYLLEIVRNGLVHDHAPRYAITRRTRRLRPIWIAERSAALSAISG